MSLKQVWHGLGRVIASLNGGLKRFKESQPSLKQYKMSLEDSERNFEEASTSKEESKNLFSVKPRKVVKSPKKH